MRIARKPPAKVVSTAIAVSGIAITSEAARGIALRSGSGPRAARALSVDDQVVPAHRVPKLPGEALELSLETIVLERRDPAAAVADRVVVVFTARDDRLEARTTGPELDTLHQPELIEEVERTVDAG